MTVTKVQIKLPISVIIPLKGKFKVRKILNRDTLLFHIMLKQGITLNK